MCNESIEIERPYAPLDRATSILPATQERGTAAATPPPICESAHRLTRLQTTLMPHSIIHGNAYFALLQQNPGHSHG
jgi:hypothetical protein